MDSLKEVRADLNKFCEKYERVAMLQHKVHKDEVRNLKGIIRNQSDKIESMKYELALMRKKNDNLLLELEKARCIYA